jgi:hypothetical protein
LDELGNYSSGYIEVDRVVVLEGRIWSSRKQDHVSYQNLCRELCEEKISAEKSPSKDTGESPPEKGIF